VLLTLIRSHQGVVSKGRAKKDLGSDLYHGVTLVKTSGKLEGGNASTSVRSVWIKIKRIEASLAVDSNLALRGGTSPTKTAMTQASQKAACVIASRGISLQKERHRSGG